MSVLVIAACALAVGAAAGYAVRGDEATVVHTCYRVGKDGSPARYAVLRLVTGDATCKRSERSLVWSQKGLPGPAGPAGAAGPPGPAGPSGPSVGNDCNLERRIAKAVAGFEPSADCAPPPLCNDDGFEPNNTPGQATPVDLGTTTSGVACALDDDYFAVAAGGATVTASLTFDSTAVLEIALLDSAGNVLATASGSSPQSVSTPGPVAGTVYVRVRAVGNAQGAYTLTL